MHMFLKPHHVSGNGNNFQHCRANVCFQWRGHEIAPETGAGQLFFLYLLVADKLRKPLISCEATIFVSDSGSLASCWDSRCAWLMFMYFVLRVGLRQVWGAEASAFMYRSAKGGGSLALEDTRRPASALKDLLAETEPVDELQWRCQGSQPFILIGAFMKSTKVTEFLAKQIFVSTYYSMFSCAANGHMACCEGESKRRRLWYHSCAAVNVYK